MAIACNSDHSKQSSQAAKKYDGQLLDKEPIVFSQLFQWRLFFYLEDIRNIDKILKGS